MLRYELMSKFMGQSESLSVTWPVLSNDNDRGSVNLSSQSIKFVIVQDIRLDHHNVQYLYNDGEFYHFMDLETYEQPAVLGEILGEATQYLKENLEVKLTFFEGEAIDIDLPTTIDVEVVQAEASVRGDTATGVTKKVVTETGLEVDVPAFVETGNIIRVDTRSGTYVTRV